MEQRNYEKDMPEYPPVGMIDWLKGKGLLSKHLLIYRADRIRNPLSGEFEKMVKLTCSACHDVQWAAHIPAGGCHNSYLPAPFGFLNPANNKPTISGEKTVCPMCGAAVEAVHIGSFRRNKTVYETWPMTIHRVAGIAGQADRLALMGWYVSKNITSEGNEEISVIPYEGYVVEERKVVRLMGYRKCLSSISFLCGLEQRKSCLDNWGEAKLIFPWKRSILRGTTAENSKLDLYLKQAEIPMPVTYLRIWQRHKNVENLVVQGAGRLLGELIDKEMTRYSYERARGMPVLDEINWKACKPFKMLGLTKEEFQVCRDMRWDASAWRFYKDAKAAGLKLKLPEDMAELINLDAFYWCNRILKEKEVPLMPTVRYLKKQSLVDKRADRASLEDYWRMARGEGYDMMDRHVRFPKNLMREHDRVMAERRAREEAEQKKAREEKNRQLQASFAQQFERLDIYSWARGGILIRPAKTPEELDTEGKVLNHCVATYKQTHSSGTTAIFFIRRKNAPDKPWYTLQLDMKELKVLQNRGKCNCARTPEVQKFEEEWLRHIRELKQKKPKNKKEVKIA